MQGLQIAQKYYEEYGAPALHQDFPELEGLIAVGLAGSGSECYGFDDQTSADHDFEPGFCLWLPEESVIDEATAFRLERMYAKLPKEFMGLKKNLLQPAGGKRQGVFRCSEFLSQHIGKPNADLTIDEWFAIPDHALSEVVNGQVWRDDSGFFTALRQKIQQMPEDVHRKKLVASLYIMGQSGSYNYGRCIAHGEKGAAQLALAEFAKRTMHVVFLLNRAYMPYYKWSFRALRGLALLPELGDSLEYLLNTGNEPEDIPIKTEIIERIEASILEKLCELNYCKQSYVDLKNIDLGAAAIEINETIKNSAIKNANLLAGLNPSL